MSSMIFLLILTFAISLPEIGKAADDVNKTTKEVNPMAMVRTTLKSWHTMYNSYQEEISLGYCWADYLLDVKNFLHTLTGPRVIGINPGDSSPLIEMLKSWFDSDEKERTSIEKGTVDILQSETSERLENSPGQSYNGYYYADNQNQNYGHRGTENPSYEWDNVNDNNNNDNGQVFTDHRPEPYQQYNPDGFYTEEKPGEYFYPGIYNWEKKDGETGRSFLSKNFRSFLKSLVSEMDQKSNSRGLSDLLISGLGFNVPPGLGPLMLGFQRVSPIVIVVSRMIGTFVRIGKQFLDTIETTSILHCSKEYLLIKLFRWIDS